MSSLHQDERILKASDKIVATLRDSTEQLTPEQEWDILNAEFFDPETLREKQGEDQ